MRVTEREWKNRSGGGTEAAGKNKGKGKQQDVRVVERVKKGGMEGGKGNRKRVRKGKEKEPEKKKKEDNKMQE